VSETGNAVPECCIPQEAGRPETWKEKADEISLVPKYFVQTNDQSY
jgi:hypothetical protein